MREFKVGDRVRLTAKRLAANTTWHHPNTGIVIECYVSVYGTRFIRVNHRKLGSERESWYPQSLEFDNDHRQPCSCFECE